MPDEARLLAAFGLALAATLIATPMAIAVATRTDFHDRPLGYKGHQAPTPYLGGAAVFIGFLLASGTLGDEFSRLAPLLACAFAVWGLGTLDDRVSLPVGFRLATESALATALWASDLGWDVFGADWANLLLTNAWVLGLVNAFNLMDNMDGAAATVGSVTALAVAGLALIEGDIALAALCVGLCGACAGFLRYNLASPARIFLGDGGSLTIGLVLAGSLMAVPSDHSSVPVLLAAVILAGLPVVDTALVLISRGRGGVPLLQGGRDHITHRLLPRLAKPRAVAITLGAVQAVLGVVAVAVVELGEGEILFAWCLWFAVVTLAVALLETETWKPAREPAARRELVPRRPTPSFIEAAAVAFITFACGLSPLLDGFYDPGVWAPITVVLLAALFGLTLARPVVPRRSAVVAFGGLAALWVVSLTSIAWSESADRALTEANRWLLYLALFGLLIALLRNDRLARILFASLTTGVLVVSLYLIAIMVAGDGPSLFSDGRLVDPIGYVNAQAGYFMLGFWPLVATAAASRSRLLSAGAVGAAALLGGLVVLTQTRAAPLAFAVTAVLLVAVLPGRTRRVWVLVTVLAGVAAMGPLLLEVYTGRSPGGVPDTDSVRAAALALLAGAIVIGVAWAVALRAAERWAERRSGRLRPATASTAALGGLAVAALAGLVLAVGNPVAQAEDELRSFVNLEGADEQPRGSTRFATAGGNRYDYWRIAVDEFASAPLAGLGAGNYTRDYFVERRTLEDVTQPHSIELQTLAELGLLGVAALLAFLGGVGAGLHRRLRQARADPRALGLTVAAGGTFITWLVHTSVDWLHVIPGVTGMALFAAAVLVSPWPRERGSRAGGGHALAVALCAVLAAAGALTVGRAALADRYRSQAEEVLASDPREAIRKADDSLELNDEALDTYYVKSAAYARLGDYQGAMAPLLEAARREPSHFVAYALMGDVAKRYGDYWLSRNFYIDASERNPREETLANLALDPNAYENAQLAREDPEAFERLVRRGQRGGSTKR
jgi:UDP-GlcNAc:undecaprenyl-phosphate GlcNAc-1-phosphate transferase